MVWLVLAVSSLGGCLAATSLGPPIVVTAAVILGLVLVQRFLNVPWVVLLVLGVLSGYVLLNRNFAELQIRVGPLPIYVGEILLGISLPWAALRLRSPAGQHKPFWLFLGLWLAYATVRFLFGGLDYGIDGIRDFALAYYTLFSVVGYVMWPALPRVYWMRYFVALFVALIPIEGYVVFAGPFGVPIPGSDDPTLVNRQDVMAVSLIAAATFFLLVLRSARLLIGRVGLSSVALALVIPQEVRAATMGVVVLLGVFAIQRRWGILLGLVGLPVVAFALVSIVGIDVRGRNGSTSPEAWINRQISTVNALVDGEAIRAANRGAFTSQDVGLDTVAWRLAWWNALVDDVSTSVDKTAFGLGFGADLTEPLGFQPDPTNPRLLRSPHNFLVTLLARTGVVGLTLWLGCIASWITPVLQSVRHASRTDRRLDADFVLWLLAYPVMIIVAAIFGVVLEGPYGAIPCYLLLGMSLRSSEALAEVRTRAALPRQGPALQPATQRV
jgi:hypothetical protein